MTELSQNTVDQPRGPATGQLHPDVMIEFDRQDIDVCQALGQAVIPRTQVRGVTDRPARLSGLGFFLNAKPECRAAVMLQLERLAADAWDRNEILPGRVDLNQSGELHFLKLRTPQLQGSQMLAVTEKRHPQIDEPGQ